MNGLRRVLFFFLGILVLSCTTETKIDGKTAVEWIGLLNHEDWTIQAKAQANLVRLGVEAIPFLKRGARGPDPLLRKGSIVTLGKLGSQAKKEIPFLLGRIAREEIAVIRAEIIKALAAIERDHPKAQKEFQKRLQDQSPLVRQAAKQALEPPRPKEKALLPKSNESHSQSLVLRQTLTDHFQGKGISFGLVAEILRENRRAAVVWPGIKDNKIADERVVAIVFERESDGNWKKIQDEIVLSDEEGPSQLALALGGKDKQQVVRSCGVEKEEVAAFLEEQGQKFKEALNGGSGQQAMEAYEEITNAFDLQAVLFTSLIPETLSVNGFNDPPWKLSLSPEANVVSAEIRIGNRQFKGNMELQACSGGVTIVPPSP